MKAERRILRQAYGFEDIALVPGNVTINPDQTDIGFDLLDLHFPIPIIAAAMDAVVEQGKRHPSAELLRKIAPTYGAGVKELLSMAGYLDEPKVQMSDQERVEWAFDCVISDPDYRFGTSLRTSGDLSLEAKRFIVEVYEKATGKKLL